MNFLVLGGTGFIGTKICSVLAQSGHAVRAYSPSAGRTEFSDNITGVSGLIADKGELTKQVEWCGTVIHLVSTTNPKTSFSDPYHDVSSNLLPLVQLLEIIRTFDNKKIIFCSSGGTVYGMARSLPIKEDHPKNPSTSYGLVKSAMEDYIQFYNANYQLPFLIVRPANVYGPKLRSIGEQGIISTLVYNALNKKETNCWANPSNIRDYVFIEDFADALMSLINVNAEGIFNVGSGKGYVLNEIIASVEKIMKEKMKINFSGEKLKDEPSNVLDISKINTLTGWLPKTSLESGIHAIHLQLSSQS